VNFDLSEDEEMLKALTERLVTNTNDHTARRTSLAEPSGFLGKNLAPLGDLGPPAAQFPEAPIGIRL